MIKINSILFFVSCLFCDLNAQKKPAFDSIFIFNQNPTFLDSFVRVEGVDNHKAFKLIEAKLKLGHYISNRSIEFVLYAINRADKKEKKCDSLRIFLCDRLLLAKPIDNVKLNILRLQKEYIEYGGCRLKEYSDTMIHLLEKIIAIEYRLKLENDLSLLMNRNHLGRDYLRLNKYELADYQFSEVLGYPFALINGMENYDYMNKCREEYRRAGMSILDARRGSLSKLKYTFFVPAFWEELEPIKKMYIEEMGGEYKHPSSYSKSKVKE